MTALQARRLLAPLVALPVLLLGVAGAAGAAEPADAAGSGDSGLAPLVGAVKPNVIKDRYLVVLRGSATSASVRTASTVAEAEGARVHHRYATALHGFAATLTPQALAALRADPDVAYVEADRTVSASETSQSPATWGLDRIDQRLRPLDNTYRSTSRGTGVRAYVIDTGIRRSHAQFGGRAVTGYDAFGGSGSDCNGHGTHVAGTIGGSTYGVAKGATLVPVRVLDCDGSGTVSGVVAGVNWVTAHHAAGKPAVANMSLGGGASATIDNAVATSIRDGVTYSVAAGNDSDDACGYSPARVGGAITVGATEKLDTRAAFSNVGTCLDLFAPGAGIKSAWYAHDTATQVLSGTSMAAPHVAGAAALYLQTHPAATPAAVRAALVDRATTSVVVAPGTGSPNRLLYSRGL